VPRVRVGAELGYIVVLCAVGTAYSFRATALGISFPKNRWHILRLDYGRLSLYMAVGLLGLGELGGYRGLLGGGPYTLSIGVNTKAARIIGVANLHLERFLHGS